MTLQQLLGIELPIIQAPMAGVQGSALAVVWPECERLQGSFSPRVDPTTGRRDL